MRILSCLSLLLLLGPGPVHADKPPAPPRTVAETSDYKATSRHTDVVAFCEALTQQSSTVKLDTLGPSHEGRKIPLLIVADPPVSTPAQVGKRTVVALLGNIHAGEVDGKEALLMLARDLAGGKDKAILKDLVLLIVPNFNPDGNEKLAKTNRPEQNGPPEVGTRANAQGFDLNRDFIKLESPEVRALVRLLNVWDPSVLIDTHTTNGSYHRYPITYDGPRHPAGDAHVIGLTRDTLLPAIGTRLLEQDKLHSFFYGNFAKDHTRWESYPPLPRYGISYVGLRNRIAILCESYNYDSYKDRVRASHAFVRTSLEKIAENKDKVRAILSEAREATLRGGKKPRGDDHIALRFRTSAFKEPSTVFGFVEEMKDGKNVNTGKPRDYKVEVVLNAEPSLSVARPFAYLFPASSVLAVETLQRHGIDVEELREDVELDVEVYKMDRLTRALVPFQKHNLLSIDATVRKETRLLNAGTVIVRTAQPLGTLAGYLLEPQAEDGLAAWNVFDRGLAEGKDFPVLRLTAPAFLTTGRVRPLKSEPAAKKKPITLDAITAGQLPNFHGTPVHGLIWLEDGEHFLQMKERQLLKVHAVTGRATPFVDHEKLARCLASIPGINKREAEMRSRAALLNMNKSRTGILVEQESDLFYCPFDAEKAVRLTKSPGRKDLATFSPDGKHVSFVRAGNLRIVDIEGKAEKDLTADGGELITNGKADWVYFEEIFNRNWNAHWWSPDSKYIAFLRLDDTKLKKFTVVDEIPLHQGVEQTHYPKAGDPNPIVKLGIVRIADGKVNWVPLGDKPEDTLVNWVGWTPDSAHVVHYVQNRSQTWLDFRLANPAGEVKTLYHDKTKAWIDDPGPPSFLKDGSFILPREETGWKHLYHYSKEGKLLKQLTSGEWEARALLQVDEANGWVYFLGTRDSPTSQNLYRVKLDATGLALLSSGGGDHVVQVSPKGNYVIDSWSDNTTPTKVHLHSPDGAKVRMLDTNPVYAVEDYEFLAWEVVQIKTPDGFLLEGMILTPPRPDPKKKYPVWVKTYGGPHTPTIKDNWLAGRGSDQALARAGYVVFLVDPRSASGKGAASAWTAYKQLGVQELKDLETAVNWLCQRPHIDAKRIGLSGHSYGGFLTAYALTHSKLFAAGIAGAPVTDWSLYDSIYTERYMLTPKENPQGYAKTSVVKAAKDLHGKLLLVHGLMDDNVHVQNTMRFVDELQKANKDFELMVYPRARHPILGTHYRRQLLDFMQRALHPES